MEVDASTELVKEFDLRCDNGKWITIKAEFEWVLAKCTICGVFGHSIATCGKQKTSREGTGLIETDKEAKAEIQAATKKTKENRLKFGLKSRRKGKERLLWMMRPFLKMVCGRSLCLGIPPVLIAAMSP